ncbi:hypothetical protein C9J85_07990 [Haloferax sp. wsp5]|nr:hypothetical protein C9J85_07990 [Haloferax sp. wsp5]
MTSVSTVADTSRYQPLTRPSYSSASRRRHTAGHGLSRQRQRAARRHGNAVFAPDDTRASQTEDDRLKLGIPEENSLDVTLLSLPLCESALRCRPESTTAVDLS